MIRSLRWRLVLATAIIITAVAVAGGFFSRFAIIHEFNRFLVQQRLEASSRATVMIRAGGRAQLGESLRRVYAQWRLRTIVTDENDLVIAVYPPEVAAYQVEVVSPDVLDLKRFREGDHYREVIRLKGMNAKIAGIGTVWFLPMPRPPEAGRFRVSVDRWLLAGLAFAALLAVAVMVMFFRRVFAPVEALTRGARSLASGKLDTRVDVRGNDEVGELANAFNAMADALERNERARRNMVSDVAHELRTPLTNIRVQLEAVQDGILEPDARFLAAMEEDTATLSRLIDDLQQLSLAEAGQLRLEREDLEVRELVTRALDSVRRRIAERGLQLVVEADGEIVRVDPRRITQVLLNLVVNALTYARSAIRVSTAVDGAFVVVRVEDDGPGVPAEHAERIFDRFYRADAARSRTTGGAGLGLAIARQLVELHGGTIRLDNKPGAGAAFVFTIPRA
ncbi:MAG TPA: ATP-binding protein [Thermoanaerobaculia bacterium]|jgi:signal transduction histidine kinase